MTLVVNTALHYKIVLVGAAGRLHPPAEGRRRSVVDLVHDQLAGGPGDEERGTKPAGEHQWPEEPVHDRCQHRTDDAADDERDAGDDQPLGPGVLPGEIVAGLPQPLVGSGGVEHCLDRLSGLVGLHAGEPRLLIGSCGIQYLSDASGANHDSSFHRFVDGGHLVQRNACNRYDYNRYAVHDRLHL